MKMTSYRSAAELYARLSGFSRQSLAASQVARIVGNCFRNPAQMRSREYSRVACECVSARARARVFARKRHGRSGGSADPDV